MVPGEPPPPPSGNAATALCNYSSAVHLPAAPPRSRLVRSRAEQLLADALALSLQVAQTQRAPTAATGGYPVQQMHAILAEEMGLARKDGALRDA